MLAERYYTVVEVAEIFRVSTTLIYGLISSGEIPAVRVGRNFRIDSRIVERIQDSGLLTGLNREDDKVNL